MILFEKKTPSEKLTSMIWDWCGKYLFLGTSQGNILIWDLVEVKLVCTTVAHEGKFKYLKRLHKKHDLLPVCCNSMLQHTSNSMLYHF